MPHDVAVAQERALSVNGELLSSRAPTLGELLRERGLDPAGGGFACAVNGCFVPRAQWDSQALAAGDCVDIVAPVVGG
jgi:sulfur carrier protein